MTISLRFSRYFRYLALAAFCGGTAMIIFTGMGMKWIGFSRVFGMYFGMFFLPIALLELCALIAEKYLPDREVAKSTVVTSAVWSLLLLILVFFTMSQQSEWRYSFAQTSDALYRLFPDNFKNLLGGSVIIVCVWLVPLAILNGFIAVLKRWRERGVRQALILWQIAFLTVILWGFFFQKVVQSRIVNVAESYFNPVQIDVFASRIEDAGPFVSFTLVLLFWSALFFVLRYAVRQYGSRSTAYGFGISILLATALIFFPHIPPVAVKRGVDFVHYGGWYTYKLPHLLPLRIWVASLLLMGGTLFIAGLIWFFRREKSTVQSG